MLPAKDEDAIDVLILTIIVAVLVSLLLFVMIVVFKEPLIAWIHNPLFSPWLYFIPLFVVLSGVFQPLNYWLIRKKHYTVMSSRSVLQTISTSIVQLSLGLIGLTKQGLFVGIFSGQGVGLGVVGWKVWRGEKDKIAYARYENIKERAREYKGFPLYDAPASLLNTAALYAPILFIAYFYGPVQAGFFSLTMRVLSLPSTFIGKAIGEVYYNRIAELRHHRPEELTPFILRSAKSLTFIIVTPVLVLGLFGPRLFSFVFGDVWHGAGVFAQIMAVTVGTKFVVSPLSTIMSVSGNIKLGAKWKMIYFLSSYITLFVAGSFSIKTFIFIYSIHEIVIYLFYFYLIGKASRTLR